MKSGFDLLVKGGHYSTSVIGDFEKLLGKLPEDYKDFLIKYKTGYPSINKMDDTEVFVKDASLDEIFIIESFVTLPEAMDKLYHLDRAYGLSVNHRRFKLLPLCTSGSSYREYFLKIDTGEVFFLNPNYYMDEEIDL